MKLFIPPLKMPLTLTKPATVPIYHERRNEIMLTAFGGGPKTYGNRHYSWCHPPAKPDQKKDGWDWDYDTMLATTLTIPAGTVLLIDRYYIRNGADEFDSLTFRVASSPDKKWNKKRFWLRLSDVNALNIKL